MNCTIGVMKGSNIFNATSSSYSDETLNSTFNSTVNLYDELKFSRPILESMYNYWGSVTSSNYTTIHINCSPPSGRYVIIQQDNNGRGYLTLCEIEIYLSDPTSPNTFQSPAPTIVEPLEIECCCTCCSLSNIYTCSTCSAPKLSKAKSCALTLKVFNPNKNVLLPPALMNGSCFKDRLDATDTFKQMEDDVERAAKRNLKEKEERGFKLSDLLISCLFDGEPCDYDRDFQQFYNPYYGNCYVYNSMWNASIEQKNSRNIGPKNGLQMLLKATIGEKTWAVESVLGMKVVVLPGKQLSFPEDEGLIVRPGSSTFLSLKEQKVERLDSPHQKCISDDDINLVLESSFYSELYGVEYRPSACKKTCYQKNVVKQCGCFDARFPWLPRPYESHPSLDVCSRSSIRQDDCMYNVTMQFNLNLLSCDCPERCRYSKYESMLSYGFWPSVHSKDRLISKLGQLGGDPEFLLRHQLLQLNVYYSDLRVQVMSEYREYKGFGGGARSNDILVGA
ncbi:hypothetical protein HELRODRAFT_160285 [Helobdella robusta]|uniref:Uncharacterized protein n=1 Tax=Helobdella robusta TaxID=6412 RepID=T1EQ20_HELRO|nr:hypothetical protein HELRODRAFT_160285 [Helobdella robusta]ESO06139.1 hypothetical protein HELRODRAFT_160285 [Helobdella robusta]